MKIVCTVNANESIVGVASTLSAMGDIAQTYSWNQATNSSLDMIDELHPDIIMCESREIDAGLVMGLTENPSIKLVCFGMSVPASVTPALICFPNELKPEHIKLINRKQYPAIQIAPAANIARFYNGVYNKQCESDIFYLSDIPAQTIYPKIGVLSSVIDSARLRILGPVKLPLSQYCGNASLETLCNAMKSTKVALDVNGTHMYDYAINKVCCCSTVESSFLPKMEDILKYVTEEKLRKKAIKNAYEHVSSNHTYFHRLRDIFTLIGHEEMAISTMSKLSQVLHD